MNPVKIDTQRLQGEIDALALITEGEPPVVTRVLFSEADLRAAGWSTDADLDHTPG